MSVSPSPDSHDANWRGRLQGGPFSDTEARQFADFALAQVSRTFALNIRVLPEPLRDQVLHAYLYCRMADTIEDDADLPAAQKSALLHSFAALFDPDLPIHLHDACVKAFPTLLPEAWRTATDWEKILLNRAPLVLAAFPRFPDQTRQAMGACVRTMCEGMADFALRQERLAAPSSEALIRTVTDLDRYCWFVAGTVGVMLCDLFITHAQIPVDRATRMKAHDVSFGSGLQLVNILKDLADDSARGVSWLPGDLLAAEGLTPADFGHPHAPAHTRAAARRVHATLFAKALRHLEEALDYTLAIPRLGHGSRRLRLFCLWPLFMAVETLALLAENAGALAGGARLKITRERVARIVRMTSVLWWSEGWLRAEFNRSARRIRAALNDSSLTHTFESP
jgi:farnesyl-diphosphate farnesyltransferase